MSTSSVDHPRFIDFQAANDAGEAASLARDLALDLALFVDGLLVRAEHSTLEEPELRLLQHRAWAVRHYAALALEPASEPAPPSRDGEPTDLGAHVVRFRARPSPNV
jgi:hypothetical protein